MVMFLITVTGCAKPESNAPENFQTPEIQSNTLVQVHWIGKKRLGVTAGAYYLTRLWQFPESKRLEAQTLDKLSVAPWRILRGEGAVQNAPGMLMRPLLDDALQEECYFEARQSQDQSVQTVFAIHVDEARSGLWRTNLVGVIATLAGIQTMDVLDNGRGWSLKRAAYPSHFELARVGDWTVVGAGGNSNKLFQETVDRIRHPKQTPTGRATNWIDGYFNFQKIDQSTLLPMPQEMRPEMSVSISGDGGNVLVSAQFNFAQPLFSELDPWTVPTNLIRTPLTSFTAVRGIAPLLSSKSAWQNRQIGSAPNQIFSWSEGTNAFQTYFAASLPDAEAKVQRLISESLEKANPWLLQNGYVGFERMAAGNGATWGNLPSVRPFFQASQSGSNSFLFGGLLPSGPAERKGEIPAGFVAEATNADLVAFCWERTGPRVEAALDIGQLVRLLLHRPQLPTDSASVNCLKTIFLRLGETRTEALRTGPGRLVLRRKGTVGLTAIELNWLADWLESPTFPVGLHSNRGLPKQTSGK